MPEREIAEHKTLAAFEAWNSPEGCMRRYAVGRVRHFAHRQIATFAGAITLGLLISPLVGVSVMVLALLGETLDCAVLRRVPRALDAGRPVAQIRLITTITAGCQALTISSCVLVAQFGAHGGEASLFAFAFLLAAVLNGGIILQYHPSAAYLRFGIYATTAAAGFYAEVRGSETPEGLGYAFAGLAMLAYVAWIFLRLVDHARRRSTENSRRLLIGRDELARINRDLEQSQAEARQLALVARYANEAISVYDAQGRFLWVNEGFERMKGYTLADLAGRRPDDVYVDRRREAQTLRHIRDAIEANAPHRAEICNTTKSGEEIWVEAEIVPILGAMGKRERIISTERDITEARMHAQELATARDRAEGGARAKSAFLATMSHEIRTPMNGIIGMVDLLTEGPLTADQRQYADAIHKSAEALLKIINDILDYSKLEAEKMPMIEEVFSLSACLRDAVEILRPQARERGLFLDVCHETALPDLVSGDSGRLRQIVLNLLGNGIKFTETGGVTIATQVSRAEKGHRLVMRVQDTGIGIAPDKAAVIFEQFQQAETDTTRRYGGTGLGLAISRELALRMGGDLTLINTDSPGACFELTATLGLADPDARDRQVQELTYIGRNLRRMRVLLAEDNATNRLLVRRFLRAQPIEITEAKDGQQAVTVFEAERPEIVLMDMSMPVLDGLEVTRRIRALPGAQPQIIALTANAFASDREACLGAGMNDFLSKPLRKGALMAALLQAQQSLDKAVGPARPDAVSKQALPQNEAAPWTSPHESGTTSGKSIRSSAP